MDEVVLVLAAPLRPDDVPALLADLPAGAAIRCDARALVEPDLATVDALARLQLGTRGRIRLAAVPAGLATLLDMVGLGQLFPPSVQVVGQSEDREQRRGVEEHREAGDAAG